MQEDKEKSKLRFMIVVVFNNKVENAYRVKRVEEMHDYHEVILDFYAEKEGKLEFIVKELLKNKEEKYLYTLTRD